ncbi:MAG: roadblock/LC7 domain-containing protein [Candidatus Njordarchaeia archaeon]
MDVETIYSQIYNTLNELVYLDESIKLAILSDSTGELIHFAIKEKDADETKIRLASATIAATFGGAEIIGDDFKLSEPKFLIYEFTDGDIIITKCYNKTTLAIITDNQANLGAIRVLAKKYTEKLNQLIESLYATMKEELKTADLDSSFSNV